MAGKRSDINQKDGIFFERRGHPE